MTVWAGKDPRLFSQATYTRFAKIDGDPRRLDDLVELRHALLDFIADFSSWEATDDARFIEHSRAITKAGARALGCVGGDRPLVLDPFAGGGAIPFEALRVGAAVYASDLNPVSVLLNSVAISHIPTFGAALAEKVHEFGTKLRNAAARELETYYPIDSDGAVTIGYLWARTATCEGPGCGVTVPLVRSS